MGVSVGPPEAGLAAGALAVAATIWFPAVHSGRVLYIEGVIGFPLYLPAVGRLPGEGWLAVACSLVGRHPTLPPSTTRGEVGAGVHTLGAELWTLENILKTGEIPDTGLPTGAPCVVAAAWLFTLLFQFSIFVSYR